MCSRDSGGCRCFDAKGIDHLAVTIVLRLRPLNLHSERLHSFTLGTQVLVSSFKRLRTSNALRSQ